ncbi:pentapeptide repeat-containing protein [Streptosporangium sp. NPDC023825]|uniref:pentapeptide repeat-containing protein n=1 Tax=Streptosporangium sp. NPDC023825 TaxID=3154909 RepID=UPI0034465708
MIAILCVSAALGMVALNVAAPDWVRWVCFGIALTGVVSLMLTLLLGPGARRLAGEQRPLTEEDRRELSAHERVEAINAARHTLIQAATGLVVIGGVVFTAQGLWYTAQSLETSRQAQIIAEQGQITDRYTKAVEQLGSSKDDVRLGGIYALERLAKDSPRDHHTIYDVLTAFVRQHDPKPAAQLPGEPATDVQAALTVFGRRKLSYPYGPYSDPLAGIDLRETRIGRTGFNLREVRIKGVDLPRANLNSTDLRGANLISANLTSAKLIGADLSCAGLRCTNLSSADLSYADLRDADLNGAHLSWANLRRANLSGADLAGADLSNADLRGSLGLSEEIVRAMAVTNASTLFGPAP